MSSKLMDKIYATVLPDMAAHGIEDTTENRLAYLTGLQAAWKEDPDTSPEKSLYMIALAVELLNLKMTKIGYK